VKVRRNRSDRALWRSRNDDIPERSWQVLDERNGDSVARPPGGQECSS